jgi:Patatin phospholipase
MGDGDRTEEQAVAIRMQLWRDSYPSRRQAPDPDDDESHDDLKDRCVGKCRMLTRSFPTTRRPNDARSPGRTAPPALASNKPPACDMRRRDVMGGVIEVDLLEAEVRQKEIQYSSRTLTATNQFKYAQTLRRAFRKVLAHLPDDLRTMPEVEILARDADEKVYNIVHFIYHANTYEGSSKDYKFSRRTMEEHWRSGYDDAVRTLQHPEVLQRPDNLEGVRTFDYCKKSRDRSSAFGRIIGLASVRLPTFNDHQ